MPTFLQTYTQRIGKALKKIDRICEKVQKIFFNFKRKFEKMWKKGKFCNKLLEIFCNLVEILYEIYWYLTKNVVLSWENFQETIKKFGKRMRNFFILKKNYTNCVRVKCRLNVWIAFIFSQIFKFEIKFRWNF